MFVIYFSYVNGFFFWKLKKNCNSSWNVFLVLIQVWFIIRWCYIGPFKFYVVLYCHFTKKWGKKLPINLRSLFKLNYYHHIQNIICILYQIFLNVWMECLPDKNHLVLLHTLRKNSNKNYRASPVFLWHFYTDTHTSTHAKNLFSITFWIQNFILYTVFDIVYNIK